jgi:hypothetical protein
VQQEENNAEESEEAVQQVLSGAVALLVLRQATSELPKTVATRRMFLDILKQFTFSGVESIAEVRICTK